MPLPPNRMTFITDVLRPQEGWNRLAARKIMKAKNASTMICTTPKAGPEGGLPGAIALSAGIFRNYWITNTKVLR